MVDAPTLTDLAARIGVIQTVQADHEARIRALEPTVSPGAPAISSLMASDVTTSGAVLSAVVEPRGQPFSWRFEYGLTGGYGNLAPANPAVAPVADVGATTSTLRQGSLTGARMLLAGMNVWGVADNVTGSFADGQYSARAAIANTLRSWGANYVRLRLYANYWNGLSQANKDVLVQKVVDWRDTLRAVGILTCPCWWDALDGPYAGASWDAEYSRSFAMMTAVAEALGDDPYVFFEPFNEPNGVSNAEWDTATRATIGHFRTTIGYKGLLVVDTWNWSHAYDDTYMTGIETYDATLTGTGRANVAFARHDYPNDYSGNAWNSATWTAATGGSAREHILLETEYGVYNLGVATTAWGQPASAFFASQMQTQQNLCGAAPFLFGPWLDANAITTSDNLTTTTWGGYAKNSFLADAHGSAVATYGSVGPDVSASAAEQSVSAVLSGLTPGATYHYRARATNLAGTTHSADATFVASSAPSAPTVELDHSFENTATGTGNDQVQYTGASWTLCSGGGCVSSSGGSYHYGYTAGQSYTLRFNGARLVIWAPNDTSGAAAAAVEVDGQAAGTANFYEAVSTNRVNGVRFDTGVLGDTNQDHTVKITIPPTGNKVTLFDKADVYRVTAGGGTVTAPTVTSAAATGVTGGTATVSGTVTPNGATTAWRFEYGTTTGYGSLSPSPDGSTPAGAADTVSATLTGLSPSTLHHFRLHASNSAGSANTADRTFTTTSTVVTPGRITRSGTQLMLGGRQYKFAGMNADQFVGCGNAGSQPSVTQANQYFAELNPRSITRVWVMPGMSLSNFDRIFDAAKANGQYLCVCLLNGLNQCTSFVASYGTPLASNVASWIDQVVPRHVGEPTIAMYECANEASEGNGNIGNWYEAVAARIKSIDAQVLVGTGGGNNSNNAQAIANFSAGPHVDLISYHDYYSPAGSLGPRAGIFNSAASIAGKPWYIGERGFCCGGGNTGSLATNGQRLTAEYGLYLAGAGSVSNCAGYLYWDFKLVQPENTTANFGNALWDAARSYDNSAWNGG